MANQDGLKLYDDSFTGLKKVTFLNLANNSIPVLPEGILTDESRIQTLQLQQNCLVELPRDIFVQAASLEVAYVYGNPLRCDCHARWIRTAMDMGEQTYPWVASWGQNGTELICGEPANMENYRVSC